MTKGGRAFFLGVVLCNLPGTGRAQQQAENRVAAEISALTESKALPDGPDAALASVEPGIADPGVPDGGSLGANAPDLNAPDPGQRTPKLPPCPSASHSRRLSPEAESALQPQPQTPCAPINPYRLFLDSTTPVPLTPKQKGYLAIHDVIDPFNLLTIGLNSGFTIGIDSHTAYGPGLKGFGRNVGYSFSQDATGEFIGTFVIASLVHEDPHYHRMPHAKPLRRLANAIEHVAIAQADDGHTMPNYEVLLTYPISAEISNLYVPGVNGNGPSTVRRFLTGYATEPIGNILAEFLPDFASRFHVRVIFVQNILNQISSGQPL